MKKIAIFTMAMLLLLTVSAQADLVGLWHLDGDATDSSGNSNDGSVSGATYVAGIFDQALSFDGDDYVVLPASNSILDTDTFTVEAWFRTTVNHPPYGGSEGRLVNLHRMGTESTAVSLYVEEDMIALLYYTGLGHIWLEYTVDYSDGEWHHIAVTHDATTYTLYYDGGAVASQADAFGDFGTYPAHFGTYSALNRFFEGDLDEVRIWDEVIDIAASASLGDIEVTKTLVSPELDDTNGNDVDEVPMATPIEFLMRVTVTNGSDVDLSDAMVRDPLPAELELAEFDSLVASDGTATSYLSKGKSKKVFVEWDLDDLLGAGPKTLDITANTDFNPGKGKKAPHQEYTSTGIYDLNAGATLSFSVNIAGEDIYLVVNSNALLVEAMGEEEE